MLDPQTLQWLFMILLSLGLFLLSPNARKANDFFKGSKNEQQPGFWILTSSLVISWLFAKSITISADLGQAFGLVGGVAYAGYYGSFIVAGLVIYQLRTKGGFSSIHHYLREKFGAGAVLIFTLLIAFRLFNEIWSNSMVIGSYFGETGSSGYYWAVVVFTALTLLYTMKGGMRSSLLTDLIQMLLFAVLITVILGYIFPNVEGGLSTLAGTGTWSLDQGVNLLLVAFLQCLSYPFHDPVMTDRGFISKPKRTLKAFILAGFVGALCIVLFSFVGVFGQLEGLGKPVVLEVSKLFGVGMTLVINLIMVTSAASTIDSTLSSSVKLIHLDLLRQTALKVKSGRITMILVALAGTVPVFLNPEILSATTVSGTMVLGLAPVFLLWNIKVPKLSFFLAVGAGVVYGLVLVFGLFPESLNFSTGKYADLLTVNIYGSLTAFTLYLLPKVWTGKSV
ncbi:sodium:solute symporter family transporter [Jiulongibacter sp. NS-SX5]|uniref:sodium:solute symporter family transporter n=1 Tax=Jiulongibacter sp. NS-SX5 TaxID=3463854 RepID=UPI004058F10D